MFVRARAHPIGPTHFIRRGPDPIARAPPAKSINHENRERPREHIGAKIVLCRPSIRRRQLANATRTCYRLARHLARQWRTSEVAPNQIAANERQCNSIWPTNKVRDSWRALIDLVWRAHHPLGRALARHPLGGSCACANGSQPAPPDPHAHTHTKGPSFRPGRPPGAAVHRL